MFAVDLPVAAFYARLSGRPRNAGLTVPAVEPQEVIRQALAEMVPSTAEEIAEATGLDPVVVAATPHGMAAPHRVRSEERRVGRGWVGTGRSRWWPHEVKLTLTKKKGRASAN